jgi:hydrogenase nickel incorporation protein HypA/HybF
LICRPECSSREYVRNSHMHEIRIAEDLTKIVLEVAEKASLSVVTRVDVNFGQLIQIVPDIFEFAFRETVRNTIAEDAEVIIEIIPVRLKCMNCGKVLHPNEFQFICHECGSTDMKIINGKELFVKSIEGE